MVNTTLWCVGGYFGGGGHCMPPHHNTWVAIGQIMGLQWVVSTRVVAIESIWLRVSVGGCATVLGDGRFHVRFIMRCTHCGFFFDDRVPTNLQGAR